MGPTSVFGPAFSCVFPVHFLVWNLKLSVSQMQRGFHCPHWGSERGFWLASQLPQRRELWWGTIQPSSPGLNYWGYIAKYLKFTANHKCPLGLSNSKTIKAFGEDCVALENRFIWQFQELGNWAYQPATPRGCQPTTLLATNWVLWVRTTLGTFSTLIKESKETKRRMW